MRILHRYLVRSYLVTFGFTVGVFTFIMGVGTMVRVIDLLARGISVGLMMRFFALSVPFTLQFTVPMSVMTASLLLFTRLSMDGEITAMKACGLSLWQVVSPVLVLSMALTALALSLTQFASPRSRYLQRHVIAGFTREDPLALIEEGRFVRDFPGLQVYVGRRDRRQLHDIVIYETDPRGGRRRIQARSGTLEHTPAGTHLRVDLYDVRIERSIPEGPGEPARVQSMMADHYPRIIPIAHLAETGTVRKRISDHTLPELRAAVRKAHQAYPDLSEEDLARQRMAYIVEASNRSALSFACFAFTLLGIPLGLRSKRRESSFGVIVSLGIAFLFYFVMIVGQSLAGRPELHPEKLVWIPVVLSQLLGLVLVHRAR